MNYEKMNKVLKTYEAFFNKKSDKYDILDEIEMYFASVTDDLTERSNMHDLLTIPNSYWIYLKRSAFIIFNKIELCGKKYKKNLCVLVKKLWKNTFKNSNTISI